ncbi:MAG: transposase, partial [Sphingomonas sp.]
YLVSRRQRKKVEMLFAHLKRILKLDRLRLRGPNSARDEFHLAAFLDVPANIDSGPEFATDTSRPRF